MFTSGEWLRGEIHLLRDESLEFESEELEDLTLDWEDVASLRSPRILTYSFGKDKNYTGTATMRGDTLKILVEDEVYAFHRSELLSIIEGRLREWNYWSLDASVGVITRTGNTNQDDLNAIINIRRQSTRTRWDTNYIANFGEVDDETVANNHRLSSTVDVLIARGFFITPGYIDLYSDEFQNINLRATAGAGIGAKVIDRRNLEWSIQIGAGYQSTQYVSVEAGQSQEEASTALITGNALEWDITSSIDLDFNATSQMTVPDPKGTTHHLFAIFSVELWGPVDFDISLNWDRVENPTPNADGVVPKRDDFRIAFGLGIDT